MRSRWKWGHCPSRKGYCEKIEHNRRGDETQAPYIKVCFLWISPLNSHSMYNPQFFLATMNQQPTLPPTPFANPHQYRAPSSGPSRNRRNRRNKGFRKTEPLYPNHILHESSGTVFHDCSTGVDAQIDASNNPGKGKVWRTLSKNLLMADCNIL